MTLLQLLLAAAACFGLWRLWRSLAGRGRASLIIAAGFLLRAFAAQALFWISWLRLPVAPSLQLGPGFWFFAIDAEHYFEWANQALHGAFFAFYPSRTFVQTFAIFLAAFGNVPSAGILLNCAAYLATCAIIVRLGGRAQLAALCAIAFGPSTILWSLQPLKDTLFLFLIAAMVGACARWQERRGVWSAAAMLAIIYAIAGIRWYFAVILCAALVVFAFLLTFRARRRVWTLLATVALLLVLGGAIRFAARQDLPADLAAMPDLLPSARRGFETTLPGATTIRPGAAVPDGSPVVSHLVAGGTAMFLPRVAGQTLGLVSVGGGRGLWLFAEADTLAFDAVLLFAVVYCTRALRRREARPTPLFAMFAIVFVITAGPMIYAVNNFGTLFRLRQMPYIVAALLPLTLAPAPAPARRTPAPEPATPPARREEG